MFEKNMHEKMHTIAVNFFTTGTEKFHHGGTGDTEWHGE